MVEEIVAPGHERVTPSCPHYTLDRCSGCQLQHLTYDAQLAAKRRLVGDALRRIGKLELPDPDITEAVEEWRYRGELTLQVKRTAGGSSVIGLRAYDRPGAVFQLADCHIADYRLMALWRDLRAHLGLLPPRVARVTLRVDHHGQRDVIVESAGPWEAAEQLRALLTEPDSVACWWQPIDAPPPRLVAGAVSEPGRLAADAASRTNPEMAAVARRWAVDQLGDVRGQLVWDLYGALGDVAALLEQRGARVISLDANEAASAAARARHAVRDRIRFVAGRVEDMLPQLDQPYAAVLAPPRGGLDWAVTVRLTASPVPRLVYLSLDSATLARDLQRLSATYSVVRVHAFDLEPQTAGVHVVAVLEAA
jgi:23S rRNA (uracil1939-C5)-methyltransferase